MKRVRPSASDRANLPHTPCASKGAIKSTMAPLHSAHSSLFTTPCTWWSGRRWRMRSSGAHSHASTRLVICACRALCRFTTPFGRPVVPLV